MSAWGHATTKFYILIDDAKKSDEAALYISLATDESHRKKSISF